MNRCSTCGCELQSKFKSYCKTCGDKRTKINQQKYRDKLKYGKEEFLTQISLKNKKLCNSIPTKPKINLNLQEENKDLTKIASVEDLLDIQKIIKQVKKGIKNIETVYIKYDKKYKREYLNNYIRRIMC